MDEKEIEKIIYKYRINLLISSFKKFKQMKEDAHQVIQMKNNLHEKRNLISPEGDEDLDVNLFPEENYNYIGNIFYNKKDGFGIQNFPKTNSIYIGYFLNDKRINVCKFEDKSKSYTYKGETKNNFTGKYGIYNNYGNGMVYEGEFENNRKHGIGIETYIDGGVYKGEFKNGLRHGVGSYFWVDGSRYEGEWKNNLMEGYGIYNFKDGSFCSGFWSSNQINGFGKFVYPGVKIFLGSFKKDIKSGFGFIFSYNERKAYIGYWKNNKQSGLGKSIKRESIRYGFFENGKRIEKYEENEFFNLLDEQNTIQFYKDIFEMDYDGLNEYVQNFNDV